MSVRQSLVLLSLAAAGVHGQFVNPVAPGDGATVYFSESQPLRGSTAGAQGRIYAIGSQPLALYAERPTPVIPEFEYGIVFTDYYSLARLDRSMDGSVTALIGRRDCYYSDRCGVYPPYETTVQVVGHAAQTFAGGGWLSANGRYLFTSSLEPLLPAGAITDLVTGERWAIPTRWRDSPATASRVIANNGTAVFADSGGLAIKNGEQVVTKRSTYGAADAVIDASGRTVLYTAVDLQKPSSIHIYRPATDEDTVLYQGTAGALSPAISADGKRAAFLGQGQLFTMNIDGTGLRQITSDSDGITSYTLSDDGQIAWYVSRIGRLVRVYVDTTLPTEMLPPTPHDLALPYELEAGSTFTIYSVNPLFNPRLRISIGGIAAPVVSTTATAVAAQAPWEAISLRGAPESYEIVTSSQSPFDPVFRGQVFVAAAYPQVVTDLIHQDWHGFVTGLDPVHAGEIVHFYAVGLGPVDLPIATGEPGPGNPPARTIMPPPCNVPVVFSGLAPGLIGYYQVSIQLPLTPGAFRLDCAFDLKDIRIVP